MKFLLLALSALIIFSCSPSNKFSKDKTLFEASKVQKSFKSIADLNDSYFDIKENNFFEFYRQLFDSVKNTRYPGKYTKTGDTLFLEFYNKKGLKLLGRKALIDERKKEIVFFEHYPGVKKKLIFN